MRQLEPRFYFLRIFFLVVFLVPTLWATIGASCSLTYSRISGAENEERVPNRRDCFATWACWCPGCPLCFCCARVGVIWSSLFRAVESRFCGDALEEKREEAEEGIELHQAPTMTGGMKITEGSGSEGSTGLDWCVV